MTLSVDFQNIHRPGENPLRQFRDIRSMKDLSPTVEPTELVNLLRNCKSPELFATLAASTIPPEVSAQINNPTQATYVSNVLLPVTGFTSTAEIPERVEITYTTPDDIPTIAISNTVSHNDGNDYLFSYEIEFKGTEIDFTPAPSSRARVNAPRIGGVNRLTLPKPETETNWDSSYVLMAQSETRKLLMGNPDLVQRHRGDGEIVLLPFQQAGRLALLEDIADNNFGVLNHATATGKTVTFLVATNDLMEIAKQSPVDGKKPVALMLIENIGVLQQTETRSLPMLFPGKYSPSRLYGRNPKIDPNANFIFATPSTLINPQKRDDLFKHLDDNGLDLEVLIVDEGHHGVVTSIKEIKKAILEKCPSCKTINATATLTRQDKTSVTKEYGGRISHSFPIFEGWNQGYLPKIDYLAGDKDVIGDHKGFVYPGTEAAEKLRKNKYSTLRFARLFQYLVEDKKDLVLKHGLTVMRNQATAREFAEYCRTPNKNSLADTYGSVPDELNDHTINAVSLTSDDRAADSNRFNHLVAAWESGVWPRCNEDLTLNPEGKYLSPYSNPDNKLVEVEAADDDLLPVPEDIIGVKIFNEGIDVSTQYLLLVDDTTSLISWLQRIGRTERQAPFKTVSIIRDTVGAGRREDLIRTALSTYEEANKESRTKSEGNKDNDKKSDPVSLISDMGIAVDGHLGELLREALSHTPTNLANNYGTYDNLPPYELPALDEFIAKASGLCSEGTPREKAVSALHERLKSFAAGDNLQTTGAQSLREDLLQTFRIPGIEEPVDIIEINAPNELMYERLFELLTDPHITDSELIDRKTVGIIFEEFAEAQLMLLPNALSSIRIAQTYILKKPPRELTEDLIAEGLEGTRSPHSLTVRWLAQERDALERVESGEDIAVTLEYLLGRSFRKDLEEYGDSESTAYRMQVNGRYLTALQCIRAICHLPTFSEAGITPTDFFKKREDFIAALSESGLLTSGVIDNTKDFISLLNGLVDNYVRTIDEDSEDKTKLVAFIRNEEVADAASNISITDVVKKQLLDAERKIKDAQAKAKGLTEEDQEVLIAIRDLLTLTRLKYYATTPSILDHSITAQRGAIVRSGNEYLDVSTKGHPIDRKGPDYNPLSIRTLFDSSDQQYVFLSHEGGNTANDIESLYQVLGRNQKRELLDSVVEFLEIFIDSMPEVPIFLPTGATDHSFHSDLTNYLLANTNLNLLAGFTRVSSTLKFDHTPETFTKSRLALHRERLQKLRTDHPNDSKKPPAKRDAATDIQLVVHDFLHIHRDQVKVLQSHISGINNTGLDNLQSHITSRLEKYLVTPRYFSNKAVEASTRLLRTNTTSPISTKREVSIAALMLRTFDTVVLTRSGTLGQNLGIGLNAFMEYLKLCTDHEVALNEDLLNGLEAIAPDIIEASNDALFINHPLQDEVARIAKQCLSLRTEIRERYSTTEATEIAMPNEPLATEDSLPPFFSSNGDLLVWRQEVAGSGKRKANDTTIYHLDPNCEKFETSEAVLVYSLKDAQASIKSQRSHKHCPGCSKGSELKAPSKWHEYEKGFSAKSSNILPEHDPKT